MVGQQAVQVQRSKKYLDLLFTAYPRPFEPIEQRGIQHKSRPVYSQCYLEYFTHSQVCTLQAKDLWLFKVLGFNYKSIIQF